MNAAILGLGATARADPVRLLCRKALAGCRCGVGEREGASDSGWTNALNGFVSEFLIYLGSLRAVASPTGGAAVPALVAIGGLALIGGGKRDSPQWP